MSLWWLLLDDIPFHHRPLFSSYQVYERLGWKDIRMSRALRAACGSMQTPRSYTDVEGASLMLELHENERECEYKKQTC